MFAPSLEPAQTRMRACEPSARFAPYLWCGISRMQQPGKLIVSKDPALKQSMTQGEKAGLLARILRRIPFVFSHRRLWTLREEVANTGRF